MKVVVRSFWLGLGLGLGSWHSESHKRIVQKSRPEFKTVNRSLVGCLSSCLGQSGRCDIK